MRCPRCGNKVGRLSKAPMTPAQDEDLVVMIYRSLLEAGDCFIRVPYNPKEGIPPFGYMVSLDGSRVEIPGQMVTPNVLRSYLKEHRPSAGTFFSAWIADGKCCLDNSVWFADYETAMWFGEENMQRSVWSCAYKKAISVDTDHWPDPVDCTPTKSS